MKSSVKLSVYAIPLLAALGYVPAAAASVPAWCSAIGNSRIDTDNNIKDAVDDQEPRNALKNIVGKLCKPDAEVREHMSDFDAARQRWSRRLDLTESDWADVADYATLGQGERMSGEVHINTNGEEVGIGHSLKRAWSAFDALDQYAMLRADAGASGDFALDHNYLADALGPRLSEVGRFAYVRDCITRSDHGPVHWAMCQGDIALLDLKKLAAELRANKAYKGADKMRIRIEVDALKADLDKHAAKIKKLIASDAGYAKLFEAGAAARKEWEGRYKTDAALLELVNAMDDARATNSRKAFAGCEEKVWAAWKTAVSALPAKKFEGMHDEREQAKNFIEPAMGPLINDPGVYLAAVALNTCMTVGQERDAKHDVLTRALGDAMQRWPGFRGPRTATQSAILASGIALDDRDAKLEYPNVSRDFAGGGGSRSGGGNGVVAKLKPSGKTTVIEFKKQLVKQVQCAQVKVGRRITQIRSDGTLVYETTCVKNETVTVDKSDAPQTVNPRYLTGVKPGMFVSVVEDVVTAVWAKPGATTPSMVFGVAVK